MERLEEKINKIGIDKIRFFVPMSQLHNTGFGICYKSSNDNVFLTECYIDESNYKVSSGYKIELRAIDKSFGSETYYQSDLESLINEGHIYIKEDGEQVELFVAEEPLTPYLNIRWFGTRIINSACL